jgi:hypothetical protein
VNGSHSESWFDDHSSARFDISNTEPAVRLSKSSIEAANDNTMPAEEHRPQWELCRTRKEKHRRAVFMMYKDLIMGSLHPEQLEICVDIRYEKLKSSSNGLARRSVVEICVELIRNGWFDPCSLARVYLDGLEKKVSGCSRIG